MSPEIITIFYIIVSVIPDTVNRYYPLKSRLRVSLPVLVSIYAAYLLLFGLIFFSVCPEGSYSSMAIRAALFIRAGTSVMPFLFTKKSFWQNAVLLGYTASVSISVNGIANFVEYNLFPAFTEAYPLMLMSLTSVLLYAAILPLTLKMLNKLIQNWTEKESLYTRTMWVIPAAFCVISVGSASILQSTEVLESPVLPFLRLILALMILLVQSITSGTITRIEQSEKSEAKRIVAETQLEAERRQNENIASDYRRMSAMRHDLRHHLSVIEMCIAGNDIPGAVSYCRSVTQSIEDKQAEVWCSNFVLNAIVSYYASMMKKIDCKPKIIINISDKKAMADSDICIIVGNLLENAVESCSKLSGERYISLNIGERGGFLAIHIENPYSGTVFSDESGLHSTKDPDNKRHGIGLSSVKMICDKYNGIMSVNQRTEQSENIWDVSVVIPIKDL
jgi:hypothetical protein